MAKDQEIKIMSTPIKIDVATPTEIANIALLENQIAGAKEPQDLIMPGITLDALTKAYTATNKQLKEAIKVETDKASAIKKLIDKMIDGIKEQALKVVSVKTKQSVSKTTGEIKNKTIHNLPMELFSYTPPKKAAVVDTKAILEDPEKYKKYVKPVTSYELDMEAISAATSEELPWVEKNTDAKISFKKLDSVSMNKLLGVSDEK